MWFSIDETNHNSHLYGKRHEAMYCCTFSEVQSLHPMLFYYVV